MAEILYDILYFLAIALLGFLASITLQAWHD